MTIVFHIWSYGRFIEIESNGRFIGIQSNLRRKKPHRMNQGTVFLEAVLAIQSM